MPVPPQGVAYSLLASLMPNLAAHDYPPVSDDYYQKICAQILEFASNMNFAELQVLTEHFDTAANGAIHHGKDIKYLCMAAHFYRLAIENYMQALNPDHKFATFELDFIRSANTYITAVGDEQIVNLHRENITQLMQSFPKLSQSWRQIGELVYDFNTKAKIASGPCQNDVTLIQNQSLSV